MRCFLYHPALLPSAEPVFWRHGLHCPARLAGSFAQFNLAIRFNSPGNLPSSAAGSVQAPDCFGTSTARDIGSSSGFAAVLATAVRQARVCLHRQHSLRLSHTSTDREVYDHVACHNSPAISSSGVRCGSSRCAPSPFRGNSIVRPTPRNV